MLSSTIGTFLQGRGIAQENITFEEFPELSEPDKIWSLYCIVGLPPPLSGQVSVFKDSNELQREVHADLQLTADGACTLIDSHPSEEPSITGFHVLLLY